MNLGANLVPFMVKNIHQEYLVKHENKDRYLKSLDHFDLQLKCMCVREGDAWEVSRSSTGIGGWTVIYKDQKNKDMKGPDMKAS